LSGLSTRRRSKPRSRRAGAYRPHVQSYSITPVVRWPSNQRFPSIPYLGAAGRRSRQSIFASFFSLLNVLFSWTFPNAIVHTQGILGVDDGGRGAGGGGTTTRRADRGDMSVCPSARAWGKANRAESYSFILLVVSSAALAERAGFHDRRRSTTAPLTPAAPMSSSIPAASKPNG